MKFYSRLKLFAFAGAVLSLSLNSACQAGKKGVTQIVSQDKYNFIQEVGGFQEYELLSNGMKVLLYEDRSAPVATLMITYQVGSRNEVDGKRGAAHILEHMMFKGTPTHNKEEGTSIAPMLQQVGAMMNATTGHDATNYYEMLPSEKLDMALDIEADRMRNSRIRTQDVRPELQVVMSELERQENSPFAALSKGVWQAAFKVHPYHYPVIGWREDVENMSAEYLKEFYDRFYRPDNAYLVLIGSFEPQEALAKIETRFGSIERNTDPFETEVPAEKPQNEERRVSVERGDPIQAVLLAHRIPSAVHNDHAAVDLLAHILSVGKTSRLYPELVDKGLAAQVSTGSTRSHDDGLLMSWVVLAPGAQHDAVEKTVRAAIQSIQNEGVSLEEVKQAQSALTADAAYARDGSFSMAGEINEAIGSGDWRLFPNFLDDIAKVTPEDIQRVAKEYLTDSRLIAGHLISNPNAPSANPELEAAGGHSFGDELKPGDSSKYKPMKPASLQGSVSISDRIRESKAGVSRVVSLKTDVDRVVTIAGSFDGTGDAYSENPMLAHIVAGMLDKGTKLHDKYALAELSESRGIHLSFGTDYKRTEFHARALEEHLELTIELLAEQLMFPKFSEDDLERVKQQETVRIQQEMSDTSRRGIRQLARMIYDPKHPNYRIPLAEELEKLKELTVADLERFHAEHYGANNLVLVAVGDVDHARLEKVVAVHFKDWKAKEIKATYRSDVEIGEPESEVIQLDGKRNIDIFLAHAMPLTRHDPEYLAAHMANAILGGDFSARLAREIRDEKGLTYGIRSGIVSFSDELQGHWVSNLIVTPKHLEAGIEETRKEIEFFVSGGIMAHELQSKQSTLIGKYQVGLATTGGLADQILRSLEWELGLDYLDEYPRQVNQLKLEEVNALIPKLFQPDKLNLVVAGDIESAKKEGGLQEITL